MTPGFIWETILELETFTFKKLFQACLAKIPYRNPYTEKMLKGKIKYILKKSVQEGRLIRCGRRYQILAKYMARKDIQSAPSEFLKLLDMIRKAIQAKECENK